MARGSLKIIRAKISSEQISVSWLYFGVAGSLRLVLRGEQRRSEKARVAAEGVLSRVMGDGSGIEVGVVVGVPRVGEGDEDTRG